MLRAKRRAASLLVPPPPAGAIELECARPPIETGFESVFGAELADGFGSPFGYKDSETRMKVN